MSNDQKNGSQGSDSGQKIQAKGKPVNRVRSAKQKQIEDDEFMAAAIGDIDWLKQSIKGNRHEVKFDKNGLDAVHIAAIHGRLECLKMLIGQMKVDVNLSSKNGWRPIHLCISNQTGSRSLTCLRYLLEQGADHSVTNDDGVTPCHQAASEGHIQCLKALIEAGARVDKVDKRGHRPIDLAKLWGYRKCARILAMQKWTKEKSFLENEMEKMKKEKIRESLDDLQSGEGIIEDQKLYGDIAYSNWLESRDMKDGRRLESKESLQKANSSRCKPSGKATSSAASERGTRSEQAGITRQSDESTADPGLFETKEDEVVEIKEPEKVVKMTGPLYGEWNKSCKIPNSRSPYVPLLPDHYPRDEYTSLPKFPPKRATSDEDFPKFGRGPMVYKCKHIADTQKRKLYEYDELPRMETGIHMTDDTASPLFKAGLLPLTTQQLYETEIPDYLRKYNLTSMMASLRKTSKPDHFPKLPSEKFGINV